MSIVPRRVPMTVLSSAMTPIIAANTAARSGDRVATARTISWAATKATQKKTSTRGPVSATIGFTAACRRERGRHRSLAAGRAVRKPGGGGQRRLRRRRRRTALEQLLQGPPGREDGRTQP